MRGSLKRKFGKLSILSGPGAGSFFFLFKERTTLGRGDENPITVYDASVSRVHCQIFRSGGKYFLTDLNATNGTFLNGEKLSPNQHYPLEPGSHVHMGSAELFFSIETIELDPKDAAHASIVSMTSGEDAIGELQANKGTQFDREVVDAFVQAYIVGKIDLEKRKTVPVPRGEGEGKK
jgi:pSer/pThr/pTyr-binding forkhead associated (FHA) protein